MRVRVDQLEVPCQWWGSVVGVLPHSLRTNCKSLVSGLGSSSLTVDQSVVRLHPHSLWTNYKSLVSGEGSSSLAVDQLEVPCQWWGFVLTRSAPIRRALLVVRVCPHSLWTNLKGIASGEGLSSLTGDQLEGPCQW